MPLSRQDTAEAYKKHRALHDAARWADLADLFADNAQYTDPFFGELHGREAIRDFLIRSMAGLEEWTFPIAWTVIDEGRVVTHWHNRLPGLRKNGEPFEFPGVSAISYNDQGEIIQQSDMYDRAMALQVIAEARSSVAEHTVIAAKAVSGPLFKGLHWLVANGK